MTEERIPRPEEVLDQEDLAPEQKIRPLRCRAGSGTDNPCPREATTWMYPEDRDYPLCDEHARLIELGREVSHWRLAEEVTSEWLRLARAWEHEDLEQLAINTHETAKGEAVKAEAREGLAREIADASRAEDERPRLTREQKEELLRLLEREAALTTGYTSVEDATDLGKDDRRRVMGVLAEERAKASEDARRYKEELGLK